MNIYKRWCSDILFPEVQDNIALRKIAYGILPKCKKCQKECKQSGCENLIKFECYDFVKKQKK